MAIITGDQNPKNLNDGLFGTTGDDIMHGGQGNDFIDSGSSIFGDQLSGDSGNDQLFGGNGNDILDGGTGDDFMQGGSGNDSYFIDSTRDGVLEFANGGIDTIFATNIEVRVFTLSDTVENLTFKADTSNSLGIGFMGLGNNLDNVIRGNQTVSSENTLRGFGGNDTLFGGTSLDSRFDFLDGGDGDDKLFGELSKDELLGGTGRDTLSGGLGDDKIDGGDGFDTFSEDLTTVEGIKSFNIVLTNTTMTGLGNDTFKNIEIVDLNADGTTLSNTFNASASSLGNVIFRGGSVADTLIGSSGGGDGLFGNNGDDFLLSGAGNDTLTGAAGVDRFAFSTVQAFSSAELGIDTLKDFAHNTDKIVLDKDRTFTALKSSVGIGFSVSSEFAVVTSDSAAATSKAIITYNSSNGKLFYNQNGATAGFGTGAQFATLDNKPALSASDFILQTGANIAQIPTKPIINGSSKADTLTGTGLSGILTGLAGNDKLLGKGGDDILLGGAGADKLNGGTGDDLIDGGAGADQLIGGADADVFVLANGAGVDLIQDFKLGVDRIGFRGDLSDISFVAGQGGTVVKAGSESLAALQGIKPAQLSLNDVVQIGRAQASGISVPTIWN